MGKQINVNFSDYDVINFNDIPSTYPFVEHALDPTTNVSFDTANVKCVIKDCEDEEIGVLTIGDGIELATAQEQVDSNLSANAIILTFNTDDYFTYGSVTGYFTGVNIGITEAVFKINYKTSNL